MASSTSLGRLMTTEWIDGNSIKRSQPTAPDTDIVNLDFAEELYGTLLTVFARVCRTYSNTIPLSKQRQNKEALGRLHLWGRDFQDGKLACVLAQSDDLRNTVIELLGQVGKVILNLANLNGCNNEFAELVRGLKTLIVRSKIIIRVFDLSDSDSDDDFVSEPRFGTRQGDGSEEDSSACEKSLFGSAAGKGDLQSRLGQLGKDLEPETHKRPSTLRSDQPRIYTAESSEDEDEGSDYGTLLECSIDCLMDLIPTMEQSLTHLQSGGIKTKTTSRVPFSVSELALPWVQNVSDKFTSADNALVERLGEANWQRYMTLRARTEHNIQSLDIGDVVVDNIPAVQIFQTAPQSIFKPLSLFHDSGLGSSVPTLPRYAVSAASHTSFLSSLADDTALALRVPPTPVEVELGDPFKCEICGHLLSNIKNRVDWKIHVFADLQPYICTFQSCAKDLITFPTRSLWGAHEFDKHRVTRSWKCPECAYADLTAQKLEEHLRRCHGEAITLAQLPLIISAAETKRPLPIEDQECPFCRFIPGKSQRNFVKHVGRHMESVALAVLPRDAAEDSDRSSDCSIISQGQLSSLWDVISDDPEQDYFFVPPDFHLHTNLKERDQELRLLDEGLFSAKREHGTASVQLYGHTESCKVRLVQHYINLSRSKFPGGIFWINAKSNDEIHASLLVMCRKYIGRTDKSKTITDIVTAWFEDRSEWLIVLNGATSVWSCFESDNQRRWPAPNSLHSSLIYISGLYDGNISSALPLHPMPLEIKPSRNTQLHSSEQNGETNLSSALFGAGVNVDPTGTISTEAGTDMDIIDSEMLSDRDPIHSKYSITSYVYDDQAYSPINPITSYVYDDQAYSPINPFSLDFFQRPSTISSGKSVADHSDKDEEPGSDGKPQVNSPTVDENEKEDVPISTYSPEPENYHTRLPRTKIHSASFTLPYAPDEHYPSRSSEITPNKLSDQSTRSGITGFGFSNMYVCSDGGLLQGPKPLPCEYPGCSVTSKSISEYTEHYIVSHGEIPMIMSKNLSDSNEAIADVQGSLLLEQPVMTPTQVPQPKLIRQNLGVDLFHKLPSHTTNEISTSGTEYIPRLYDKAGDQKIAPDGRLLDGREYRPRIFLVAGKGDILFMLATECARVLGYRDSYVLFHKNPCLYKVILDQAEKDDLIRQEILTYSYRSRQIAVVTARSMFRQFGSRIVVNGRKVFDDYWGNNARADSLSEDHMSSSKNVGEHSLTEQVMKDASPTPDKGVQKNEDARRTGGLHEYQRQQALVAEEHLRRLTVPAAPLHDDRLSSELANNNSIPATKTQNLQTYQKNQEEAAQQKSNYACPYCSTIFTRHHNLKSHLLTHTTEKPYICDKCDARFRRLHDLKRHVKRHMDERYHTCSGCKRAFARLDSLRRHIMGPGTCTSQNPITNSRDSSDVGLEGNENMRILEPITDPEYAGFQDEGLTKTLEDIIIVDRSHPEWPAFDTTSELDTSPGFLFHGSCKRCSYYHKSDFIMPALNGDPTIIKCVNCAIPMVTLESKSPSVPIHHGPWKCDRPGCVLVADFASRDGLRHHEREHHMEHTGVRWAEEAEDLAIKKPKIKLRVALLNSESRNEEEIIRCVCGKEEYPGLGKSAREAFESATYHNRTSKSSFTVDAEHLGSLLIQCEKCAVWQHGDCVSIRNAAECPDTYFCEQCRPLYHNLFTDSSTGLKETIYLPNSTSRSENDPMLQRLEDNPPEDKPPEDKPPENNPTIPPERKEDVTRPLRRSNRHPRRIAK
ncbi:hypothetical protein MMC27_008748 [Xylographa pallens]|nr:hypothetical protein [Xylographa pallens]